MKPSVTFRIFIHEPDFGACLSQVGKRAKRVNGSARAMAKPSIPSAGASHEPEVTKSTSKNPTIGPVQENDTNTRVNAMRNIDNSPLLFVALESTLLAHDDGSVSSNHPKNDRANTISNRQKKMLNTAFVASEFKALVPNSAVIISPRPT